DLTHDAIRNLLERGVNRRDDDRQVIPELGYGLGLWSGRPGDEAFGLTIHCGSTSKLVGNHVTLNLPPDGPHSLECARDQAECLFDVLVGFWKPGQAILCNAG